MELDPRDPALRDPPPFLCRARDDVTRSLDHLCAPPVRAALHVTGGIRADGVGETPSSPPTDAPARSGGYRVSVTRRDESVTVSLTAPTAQGLMFAAYGFLHRLGVRWYFPGASPTYPAPLAGLADPRFAPGDRREEPSFAKRGVALFRANDAFPAWCEFLARNRMNYVVLHSEAGLAEAAEIFREYGVYTSAEFHAFPKVVCVRDAASYARALQRARDLLPAIPPGPDGTRPLFCWLADTVVRRCPCPRHAGWNAAEVYMDFLNHLLRDLREAHPDFRVTFLVYLATFLPLERVRPGDGVILEVAPMLRCFNHSLDAPGCRFNRPVARRIRALAALFPPANRQVLGYWLDASLFSRQEYQVGRWIHAPGRGRLPHVPRVMQADLQFYRRLGFTAVVSFAVGIDRAYLRAFTSPAIFLYPQLLWDVTADVDAEIAAFCRGYLATSRAGGVFARDDRIDPKDAPWATVRGLTTRWAALAAKLRASRSRVPAPPTAKRQLKIAREAFFVQQFRRGFWPAKLAGWAISWFYRVLKFLLAR